MSFSLPTSVRGPPSNCASIFIHSIVFSTCSGRKRSQQVQKPAPARRFYVPQPVRLHRLLANGAAAVSGDPLPRTQRRGQRVPAIGVCGQSQVSAVGGEISRYPPRLAAASLKSLSATYGGWGGLTLPRVPTLRPLGAMDTMFPFLGRPHLQ